jgi:hypothetical protein
LVYWKILEITTNTLTNNEGIFFCIFVKNRDMAKYTALKDFYKVSEDKNYKIGDEIELLEDNAAPLLLGGFVVAVKVEVKKPKK